jgi:DNA replication protein DnaC
MAQALEQQLTQSGISAMSFEERLALLVDREVHGRQDRRCARLLKVAKLKYPQAAIEDLDSRSSRGMERSAVMSLALGEWVKAGHAVLITGATGAGKSWLACALAQHACRRGHSALYQRVPRLGEELRIRHANGTFTRWLDTLKTPTSCCLTTGAWLPWTAIPERICWRSLMTGPATVPPSSPASLPIEHWHQWIGDQTMADAMLDRLMQNHHRFTLTGESLRKKTHVFKKLLEPLTVSQPLFLLNRLRDGVNPDEHSGLDLLDHGVLKVRLSECRVRSVQKPLCDYVVKPPAEKEAPDALECVRFQHTTTLMGTGFNFISATVSLYFAPEGDSKKGRALHVGLKPTGICNLRDMEEADAQLAEKLVLALGVMQGPPTVELTDQPVTAVEGA